MFIFPAGLNTLCRQRRFCLIGCASPSAELSICFLLPKPHNSPSGWEGGGGGIINITCLEEEWKLEEVEIFYLFPLIY